MASSSNEIAVHLSPFLSVYKDGTVERMAGSPFVPPSPEEDPTTGVSSKDVVISSEISARIFLPKMKDLNQNQEKLPIFVYFHGGGFCARSAFSFVYHRYMNLLVCEARAIAVSVEYRLAPEHPLPAAYEDCWAALQWVASHAAVDNSSDVDKEPWLIKHGDFSKLYIGGDSAGGNIAYNLATKAGIESLNGNLKINGGFLCFPYFWGSNYERKYTENNKQSLHCRVWMFVNPSAAAGIDDPMLNPLAHGAPILSGLHCSKIFVCIAEKDDLREATIPYVEALRKSGWKGGLELVDVEGEGHCFHLSCPESEKAKNLIKRLASFIKD